MMIPYFLKGIHSGHKIYLTHDQWISMTVIWICHQLLQLDLGVALELHEY